MKEATAALQSVFPPSELGQFLALTRREKEQQVYELTQIVTGIRLFNRDCQKGGEGIDDLPHILDEANHATQEALKTYLHKIMQQIDTLTTTLEIHLHKQNEDNTAESQGEEEDYIEVPDEEIIFLKGCLIAARQQEIYTRKLLAEVVSSEGILQELLDHLTKRLVQLHDTVRFRTAIPTVEVYVLDLIDMDIVKYLIGNRQILTDVDRLSNKPGLSISGKLDTSCEHISPSAANFNDFSPQYLGFCAWAVVAGEGILIPGNLNIGLIRWNDNYYACSTAEAAVLFGQNPERFVTDALNLARRIPELVELLQLQDQLAQQKDIREKVGKEILAVKQDTGMQTVLHPIPPCTDNKYTWNVWKLKRRAIQLTNIANSATHSTQTIKSHFRSEVPLQAGPSKEKSCQTKKDSSTNVPTLGSFIFGLRGRRDDKQFKIHLTRPVDE
ncbi:Cilia-and flagella-associated protein 206 [Gryllus bimaculatus]|nr:Cilia-and flagella-associated protein 206 [Gryllus bimaculatus]